MPTSFILYTFYDKLLGDADLMTVSKTINWKG